MEAPSVVQSAPVLATPLAHSHAFAKVVHVVVDTWLTRGAAHGGMDGSATVLATPLAQSHVFAKVGVHTWFTGVHCMEASIHPNL